MVSTTNLLRAALLTPPARGSRHVEGQNLADVAKLVRGDIANAIRDGLLPAGLKASVRISRYSMGQSLDVRVTACPGVVVLSTRRVRFDVETKGRVFNPRPRLSTEGSKVLKTIESIVEAYNEVVDRGAFCQPLVSFYSHVDFDSAIEAAERAEIVAALDATSGLGAPALRSAS